MAVCINTLAQPYDSLDVNNINARFMIRGNMFNNADDNISAFEVPKGSGNHTIFSSHLWIGGLDPVGQLHSAFSKYGQTNDEFFPGPLSSSGDCDSINYNRMWKLRSSSIDSFVNGLT